MDVTPTSRLERTRRFRAPAFVLALFVLASCAPARVILDPPVSCRDCSLVVADRGALHSVAGLYLSLENVSWIDVTSMDLAFDLYDGSGGPVPAIGRNAFAARLDRSLAPNESAYLCVALDALLGSSPETLVASRVRVARAILADGSVWINPGSVLCEAQE